MKLNLSINSLFALIASVCIITIPSCIKQDKLYTPEENKAYMPQAYQDRGIINLLKVDSVQATTFGFYSANYNGAANDITGNFAVDNSLIDSYNKLNAYTGNIYQPLPANSYSLSATTTVVKKGQTSSEPLQILINPKYLTIGVKYILPVKLVSVSAGTIDSALSVTYFKINELSIRSRNITVDGTLTGNYPGNVTNNEGLTKLTDGNTTTKYLAFNYNSDLYVQLKFDNARSIDAYTITSGNDAPERDPKDWNLKGSNDGISWTTIDTKTGETFSGRTLTRTFNLQTEVKYAYYRLNITAINGAGLIQISEWSLLDYY